MERPPVHRTAIYQGWVRHRRFQPVPHEFRYPLFMLYLDPDHPPAGLAGGWWWPPVRFRRSDYHGSAALPLAEAVRRTVAGQTGLDPTGPVGLLTHGRTFGFVFNPVSFYWLFDPSGQRVEAILAEITNTPWRERRAIALPVDPSTGPGPTLRFTFAKDFHVSPFMPMDIAYEWRFTPPGERLVVHMTNFHDGRRVFDATLSLGRREWSKANLRRAILRHPFPTWRVLLGIHWQAVHLWRKGVPIHDHPARRGVGHTTGAAPVATPQETP